MDLSEKIKQILANKNITPSIFADEIGIQRSSMSHILAGRNKPSLDIVQKIVKRFPDLGLNWILDEEDLPVITKPVAPELAETKALATDRLRSNVESRKQEMPAEKKIDRILIFYTDGTYKEFKEA
ncbi:helix-turn-helix transcriptional regulator [Dyadobacter sp. CY323]|uniref:helix-turn-helix transcriptional regulator n=1 Tax=Dyadobacter sp. CY323 TaxID=2907302 RepID=UPI001F3F240E|nr:helix-turn-helix transcriptional regulator [Dyadobacter sp. CY323]MCE6992167.1 helix-turn-helix domain-containing protein [Dyadobacter sp. CY323]